MKKHKWFAALAVMVMALAVTGCSNPSSGNESTTGSSGGSGNSSGAGNSSGNIPEGFVKVKGTTITGNESWTPTSDVFVSERSITIPDMYVCDHEVTQEEYETYCKYGSESPNSGYGDGDNYPTYYVNWYDAIVYCNLRSIAEGLTPAYKIGEETDPAKWSGIVGDSANGYCGPSDRNDTWDALTYDKKAKGYRLPTEAEWEYIAREKGTSTTTYSGSDTIDEVAWYSSNSSNKTHEVKGKKANSLGIYDMSGNVWEWCYDWFGTVSSSTADTGKSSGSLRILRGGSWYNYASDCAVSYRYYEIDQSFRFNCYGFRVVRSAN
nr:SUMF1/EgtB/PvdO family nonheme iron enzyme [uncultured Treponema sp.]